MTMIRSVKMLAFWTLLLVLPSTEVVGLDIMVTGVTCDTSLAIYAKPNAISITCPNNYITNKCTFGDQATISGIMTFNGTEDFGISDSTVFATGEMNLWQISRIGFTMFQNTPLNLCGKQVAQVDDDVNYAQAQEEDGAAEEKGDEEEHSEDEENRKDEEEDGEDRRSLGNQYSYFDDDYDRHDDCPEDGSYAFSVGYTLPQPSNFSEWMGSGWTGSASIYITASPVVNDDDAYASSGQQQQQQQLAGYCTVKWETFKTVNGQSSYANPLPSGAITALIVLALLLLILINCALCLCGCNRCSRNRKAAGLEDDDVPSYRNRRGRRANEETYHDNYVSMSEDSTDVDNDDHCSFQYRRQRRGGASPARSRYYDESCTEDEESQVTEGILSESEPEIETRRRSLQRKQQSGRSGEKSRIPVVEYVSSLSMQSQNSDDEDGEKKKRRLPRMEIQTYNL